MPVLLELTSSEFTYADAEFIESLLTVKKIWNNLGPGVERIVAQPRQPFADLTVYSREANRDHRYPWLSSRLEEIVRGEVRELYMQIIERCRVVFFWDGFLQEMERMKAE